MPVGLRRERVKGWRKPPNAIVVTRGTQWGNPFKVLETYHVKDAAGNEQSVTVRNAQHAVDLYEFWLKHTPEGQATAKLARLLLRDRDLMCFCPIGSACHRETLIRIANEN